MADIRWLNTSGFSGLNDQLLLLIRDAGFSQIDASPSDFSADPAEPGLVVGEKCAALLQRYGLHLIHLRTLQNFIGTPPALRWQKREEVRQRIALSLQAGCDTLLVTPPEDPNFVEALVDDDLRWLSSEAARFSMKIIYQPLNSGYTDQTLPAALDHLRRLEQPNIGLMVDWLSIVSGDRMPVAWMRSLLNGSIVSSFVILLIRESPGRVIPGRHSTVLRINCTAVAIRARWAFSLICGTGSQLIRYARRPQY